MSGPADPPREPPLGDASADELIVLGTERRSRWWRLGYGLAAGALVAGFIVVVTRSGSSDRPGATPDSRSTSAQPSGRSGGAGTAPDHMAEVVADARVPLADEIRQSSQPHACTPVAVGHSPAQAVTAALRSLDVTLKVTGSGRVIDQYTDLCELRLRARGATGEVITVAIGAPGAQPRTAAFDRVEVGITTAGRLTTEYAYTVTEAGWTVLVGALGRRQDLPDTETLAAFSQLPRLLW